MKKLILFQGILLLLVVVGVFISIPNANASIEEEYPYLAELPPELEGKIEVRYNWFKTIEPSEFSFPARKIRYNYLIKNLSDQWIFGMSMRSVVTYTDGEIWSTGGGAWMRGGCRNGIPPGATEKSKGEIGIFSEEEYERIESFELEVTGACFCKPPLTPTNLKVENVSTEDELKLKISWTNPLDPSIEKIHLYRSNPFIYQPPSDIPNIYSDMPAGAWLFQYLSQLKDIPENSGSIIDNSLSPSATFVIDNFKLVESIEYYYMLVTESASPECQLGELSGKEFPNFSVPSEEATGIPRYPGTFSLREINEKLEWLLNKVETLQTEIAKIWEEIQALWDKLNWLIEKVLPPGLLKAQPGAKQ